MQIFSVIVWLFLLKFLQMAIWPLLKEAFGDLSYGIAYPVSLLFFTIVSWYCGLLALPVQLAVLPFLLFALYFAKNGEYSVDELRSNLKWDGLFLLCFVFLLEVRFFNPTISYAEKFMDHAFIASIMRNPIVPPADPWYTGGFLNVYYFLGHWMMGVLGITTGVPSTVVFNLALPAVLANAAVSLYAAGHLLLNRFKWFPVLTLFIVNPSFIVHAVAGEGLHDIMWGSTRAITNTITEFPLFSFLWGDVHAHVIALFNQAFLIFALLYVYARWSTLSERGRWILTICLALGLGSMPVMNSWDVLIYAPIVLLVGAFVWWRSWKDRVDDPCPWRVMILVPVISVLAYLPYYLMLETQGISGVGLVTTPSDPVEYMLVFGFFIVIFLLDCLKDLWHRPYLLLVAVPFLLAGYTAAALAMVPLVCILSRKRISTCELPAVFGLLIITFIEVIYLKDNMGDIYFRMNTVFKFSLVAWMLMGVSAFSIIGNWLDKSNYSLSLSEKQFRVLFVLVIAFFIAAPVLIPDLSYGYGSKTLDGSEWLKNLHPGDAGAIDFLRLISDVDVRLVEAEGGDYKYFSRVSSFTGIPAVIGMPFHEQMWRGDEGLVGERMSDIKYIYENPELSPGLLEKYGVTYLYVGNSEREQYKVSLPLNALIPVYDENCVQIYRVIPQNRL